MDRENMQQIHNTDVVGQVDEQSNETRETNYGTY